MRYGAIAFVFLTLAGLHCSRPVDHAGGVTDTGNSYVASIAGAVVDTSGAPVAVATVSARAVDYHNRKGSALAKRTARVRETTTGIDGHFILDSLYPGDYRLYMVGDGLVSQATHTIDRADTVIETGTHRLAVPATLTGTVSGSASVLTGMRLRARLHGFDFESELTQSNSFTYRLENVPPGDHLLTITSPSGHYRSSVYKVDSLKPGEVRTIDPDSIYIFGQEDSSNWQHSRRLYVRTGPSGLNVQQDLAGFPLLVRLDTTNFRFDQARGDGADIRFTGDTGAFLPHEIEHFDSAQARAAVWVRVERIAAGDDSLYLTMHWGNATAPDFSIPADVFPAGREYAAVWHMQRDSRDVFADATGNGCDGIPLVERASQPGYIGRGQYFNGVDDRVRVPADSAPVVDSSMMMTAWVKLDNPTRDRRHTIVVRESATEQSAGLRFSCNPSGADGSATISLQSTDGALVSGTAPWTDGWHLVAVCVHRDTADVFLDGQVVTTGSALSAIGGSGALYIGGLGGMLDEVTISRRSRSQEWIRLLWENQRRDSELPAWE